MIGLDDSGMKRVGAQNMIVLRRGAGVRPRNEDRRARNLRGY